MASIIARLVLREGFSDVSFSFSQRRERWAILFAFLFPISVGLVTYGIAWIIGLAHFVAPTQGLETLVDRFALSPIAIFILRLILASTLFTIPLIITSAGEEIGWRGYMLTRLIEAKVPYPIFMSGLIWSGWHIPLILGAGYASSALPIVSTALFVVGVTSVSFVFAYLRLTTGSIWSSILLHSVWNATIQLAFDPATTGSNAKLWLGESGILVTIALFIAGLVCRSRLRRTEASSILNSI
ncbi:CPBP family glutamic-type intramembrane protease [Phormidesmis sp. 146-33]